MYNPEVNENILLSEFLQISRGQEIELDVFNMITEETRSVTIKPKVIPSLPNAKHSSKELIGADLRFERFEDSHEKVF